MEKIIPIFEHKKPFDRVNTVNLYRNDELVEVSHNLVVYKGREFAVQKVLNVAGPNDDMRSYNITHFAIGSGGTESSNLTALVGPHDNDTTIYKGIRLASSNTNYLTYTDAQGNTIQYGAKPITLDGGSIEIIQDSGTNHYTTAKVTLIIDPSNGSDDYLTSTYLISEAALFYVYGNQVKGLFAHVCFSGKYFDPTDKVKIEWYLLF